ncbi:MAG TPA: hypothetical protein VIV60_31090 [Polyangiaceae bacterium]
MRLDLSLGCIALTLLIAACGESSGTSPAIGIGGTTSVGSTSTDVATGGTTAEASGTESSVGGTQTGVSKGGSPATGGMNSQATGGSKPATGGSPATGGTKSATGGTKATSSTAVDNPTVCDDTATTKSEMSSQYSRLFINTTNNPSKNYVAITNWWHVFSGQTVAVNGIGFKVTNTASTSDNSPVGFPTIFIGTYQNNASDGSNLPKQLSTISSVPTVFDTNATSLDTSNFNATYDVWLTANSTPLSGTNVSSPGTGGAYVMVWLYDPANRQPRGGVKASAQTVGKVSNTWDVWVDSTNPPCISYVAKTPVSALTFDLLDFLKDSTKYGVKDSMYLSIVFAGFEIWNGGNGATINKFCAKVN